MHLSGDNAKEAGSGKPLVTILAWNEARVPGPLWELGLLLEAVPTTAGISLSVESGVRSDDEASVVNATLCRLPTIDTIELENHLCDSTVRYLASAEGATACPQLKLLQIEPGGRGNYEMVQALATLLGERRSRVPCHLKEVRLGLFADRSILEVARITKQAGIQVTCTHRMRADFLDCYYRMREGASNSDTD